MIQQLTYSLHIQSLEDRFETEIDSRHPSEFTTWDVLSVRQGLIHSITNFNGSISKTILIPNTLAYASGSVTILIWH
jgi:hypothetical protein